MKFNVRPKNVIFLLLSQKCVLTYLIRNSLPTRQHAAWRTRLFFGTQMVIFIFSAFEYLQFSITSEINFEEGVHTLITMTLTRPRCEHTEGDMRS